MQRLLAAFHPQMHWHLSGSRIRKGVLVGSYELVEVLPFVVDLGGLKCNSFLAVLISILGKRRLLY